MLLFHTVNLKYLNVIDTLSSYRLYKVYYLIVLLLIICTAYFIMSLVYCNNANILLNYNLFLVSYLLNKKRSQDFCQNSIIIRIYI